ncbi:MAG: LamG domain-containing protein [Spirochaetales bacterium]|nr:LamG domain-containing protein [Spirochaetales bacterium]
MKPLRRLFVFFLCLELFSCDGLFRLSPVLDNPFDPENDLYIDVSAEIPTADLLAEYLFEGGTGDLGGSPGNYAADRFGNSDAALRFDGLSDYLALPDPAPGKFTSLSRTTLSLWFKAQEAEGTLLGCGRYGDVNDGWALRIAAGAYSYTPHVLNFHYADRSQEAGYNLVNEQWHHLVVMSTPKGIVISVDGSHAAGPLEQGNLSWDTGDLYFYLGAERVNPAAGTEEAGAFFTGWMDDLRIYDGNLSQEELYSLLLEGLLE